MPLPVQSVRAKREHRSILAMVALMLKEGREAELEKFLSDDCDREASIGPFKSEEAALGFLRDRLVFALRPDAIWLFGSRALGNARPDSDFDLLVVLPDGREEVAYSYGSVASPVVACGLPYDIVPARWSEIAEGMKQPGSLAYKAVKEGRLIYKRRKFDWPEGITAA